MSGFVAGVGEQADPELGNKLRRMSQRIAHRGDIESAFALSDRCAAAGRHWNQRANKVESFSSGDESIVLDGFVTNAQSLARDAEVDPSANAAQIILAGFRKFGPDWIARIEGSFALMVVDLRTGETALARDRFGHRPLYFATAGNRVWVGTEIKALLEAPGYEPSVNEEILHSSIVYGLTPGPQTLFSNVFKVIPGFVSTVHTTGDYRIANYWSPTIEPRTGLTLEDAKATVHSILKRNIERVMQECPGIVPTLSGGLDSALVACIANDFSDQRLTALGFGADDWPADESVVARETANELGLDFKRAFLPVDGDLLGPLRRVVSSLEEPTRFENSMALEAMAQSAPEGCTAIFTGEGADFMLGNRDHILAGRIDRIAKLPSFITAPLRMMPFRKIPNRHAQTLANYLDWRSVRDFHHKSLANCHDLLPGHTGLPVIEVADALMPIAAGWPPETRHTFYDLRFSSFCWIERMEKITALSGLECFHAFESNDMLQFGMELPNELLYDGDVSKPAIRALADDLLGDTSAGASKKQLAAPMQLWLDNSAQLRQAVLDLKGRDSRIRDYLDNKAVDRYLAAYEKDGAGEESVAVSVFRMLTFEIWLDTFH